MSSLYAGREIKKRIGLRVLKSLLTAGGTALGGLSFALLSSGMLERWILVLFVAGVGASIGGLFVPDYPTPRNRLWWAVHRLCETVIHLGKVLVSGCTSFLKGRENQETAHDAKVGSGVGTIKGGEGVRNGL